MGKKRYSKNKLAIWFLFAIIVIANSATMSCVNNAPLSNNDTTSKVGVNYAEFFSINKNDGDIKELLIKNIWNGKANEDKYLLVPRDCTQILSGHINAIPYPVKSVVCMSSSHVAYLSVLDEIECIKGISGTRFIYNEKVKELIEKGAIVDVGSETAPNYERIMAMKPDVVITYAISASDNSHIDILKKLGVRVLTIGDYLENSPIGKMEYLKLFGALTDKAGPADSLFASKCKEYNNIKGQLSEKMKGASPSPVLVNMPYKGAWYIPGEMSYISQLVRDAGGTILGSKSGEYASSQYGFEYIYSLALQSKIWLHPNALNTLSELERENAMFKNIPSFKSGEVYNNNYRSTPECGSDFWETGVVEPHIILQDLAAILHPEIFGEKQLKYYHKLK